MFYAGGFLASPAVGGGWGSPHDDARARNSALAPASEHTGKHQVHLKSGGPNVLVLLCVVVCLFVVCLFVCLFVCLID